MKAFIFTYLLVLLTCFSCKKTVTSSRLELDSTIARLETSATVQIKDWEAYNALEDNLKIICNTNPLNAIPLRQELLDNSRKMEAHIPENLKTQLIENQVAQINQDVTDFYNNVPVDEIHKDIVEKHLNAIMEAFDALNKSINQTLVHN